ncbi:MAG: hypothetical protein QY326_05275 [Bdellovibrionota bacterium]|nr:MAG: hypothetical protein QY326_05275 [Bdellovibrionota bacterium]
MPISTATASPVLFSQAINMSPDALRALPLADLMRIGGMCRMQLASDLPLPEGVTVEGVSKLAVLVESYVHDKSPRSADELRGESFVSNDPSAD